MPCGKLTTLALPHTTIISAEIVAAGTFVPSPSARTLPGPPSAPPMSYARLPAFCRVVATVRPVPDSEIKLEVWMPAEGWNGKFAGIGNGGTAGFIFYSNMAEPLARGYAVGNSDTGHDVGWVIGASRSDIAKSSLIWAIARLTK
jgi:feruloyl esterase